MSRKTSRSSSRRAWYRCRGSRCARLLIAHTKNFVLEEGRGARGLRQENPGKSRFTSAGTGCFPHYDMEISASAPTSTWSHIQNKAGAAGMINDLVRRRRARRLPQAASTAAMIKAGYLRPIAVVADGAARRNIRRCRPWPRSDFPASAPCLARDVRAGRHAEGRYIETLAQGDPRSRGRLPALQEAFKKQLVSVKPNPTLEDAQSWLNSEIAAWKKIVSEVKMR